MVLGSPVFLDHVNIHCEGKQDNGEVPRMHRYAGRSAPGDLPHNLQDRDWQERDDILYRACMFDGYTMKDIAEYVGARYSTISRAICRAEGRRGKR